MGVSVEERVYRLELVMFWKEDEEGEEHSQRGG